MSSEKIAKIYQNKIWKLHEILRAILSDKGSQFASRFMENLIKILETKQMLLTTYHP